MPKIDPEDFIYKVKKLEGVGPWILGIIGLILVLIIPVVIVYFAIQYFSL